MQKHKHRGFTLKLDWACGTVHADVSKGNYGSSLALVEAFGLIDHYDDWSKSLPVPEATLELFQKCEEEYSEENKTS